MLLEHGYNDLGIQALLTATGTPKGSFYVHAGLDACLGNQRRAPLDRVRHFFESTRQSYRKEGYLGCLLGGLSQELSGASPVFRRRIEACLNEIADQIAVGLDAARHRGDIPADADTRQMANLLVDCWEGAALRSRLREYPAPLNAMLDLYFRAAAVPTARRAQRGRAAAKR